MPPVSFGPDGPDADARRLDVVVYGPVIGVTVGRAGGGGPAELCRGLIDTGASDICIDARVALRLGLRTVDQGTIGVVGGRVEAQIHMGALSVPELGYDKIVRLFGVRLRDPTHTIILGRSFLQDFIVTFDGPRGAFHFARPSEPEPEPFDE